ncbi:hypothetical protein [Teredinibacter turnerae]|uniref:hypothetical protein n=1 Tax=Teredinibacter turnerae TaxID=2426 RepID=UPI0005F86A97|nr:hypothetical protein [Teredinibacter turnerae]
MHNVLLVLLIIIVVGCVSSQVNVLVEEHQYGIFSVNIQTTLDLDRVKARSIIFEKAASHCRGKKSIEEVTFNGVPSVLISEVGKLPNQTYFWIGTFSCAEKI